jgi:CRISPR type III-A-associated protein Csm2
MTQYRQQRGRYPPGREQRPPPLPQGYLANGYFDAAGNVLPEIIIDWAKDIADKLHAGRMTTGQLRRFFDEARRIELKLYQTDNFERVRPEILKLVAYANDAAKKNKAPQLFNDFMEQNIRWAALGKKEFRDGFMNHFECIVGFFPRTRD